jgi:hypothetical protein
MFLVAGLHGYLAISLTNQYGGEAYADAITDYQSIVQSGQTIRMYRLPSRSVVR